jgi:hypothetical protein
MQQVWMTNPARTKENLKMMTKDERLRMAVRSIENDAMDRSAMSVAKIPQVKPKLAMKALRDAVTNGTHGAGELDRSDRNLAWRDSLGQMTSPIGGRILVALYRDGLIAQHAPHSNEIPELEEYAAGVNDFRSKVEKRLDEIAANPDCALLEEISANLIDEIFIRRHGLGRFGPMIIGGLECHKGYTGAYLSNSGKKRFSGEVYCWWIDSDGNRQGDGVPETIPNRRNDPARNWGLGRD